MGAFSGYGHFEHKKCCPHVVDPKAFGLLLLAIPLVTIFLNMQAWGFADKFSFSLSFFH